MHNENNCGCVCSIQYFHGCSTAPFWDKKSITYAANILLSWQLKSSSTLQTLSSALSGSQIFISKIYYLPDKLKWDSTWFMEAQSQPAIPCSLKWVSTHLSSDSIYLELAFSCSFQCNMWRRQKEQLIAGKTCWGSSGVINGGTDPRTLWTAHLPVPLSTWMHLSGVEKMSLWI